MKSEKTTFSQISDAMQKHETVYNIGISLRSGLEAHQGGAYPGSRSTERLGVFQLPLDRKLVMAG